MNHDYWEKLDYLRTTCGIYTPSPTVTAQDYDSCDSLEAFSLNCVDQYALDDDYDEMCAAYETTQTPECVEQVNQVERHL
jgi:hypothetical protein